MKLHALHIQGEATFWPAVFWCTTEDISCPLWCIQRRYGNFHTGSYKNHTHPVETNKQRCTSVPITGLDPFFVYVVRLQFCKCRFPRTLALTKSTWFQKNLELVHEHQIQSLARAHITSDMLPISRLQCRDTTPYWSSLDKAECCIRNVQLLALQIFCRCVICTFLRHNRATIESQLSDTKL